MKANAIPRACIVFSPFKNTPEPESPLSKNLLTLVSLTAKQFLNMRPSTLTERIFAVKYPFVMPVSLPIFVTSMFSSNFISSYLTTDSISLSEKKNK